MRVQAMKTKSKAPFCKCIAKCGQRVKWSVRDGRWNAYINGHNLIGDDNPMKNPEVKAKHLAVIKVADNTPEFKANQSKNKIELWQNSEYRKSNSGENSPNYIDGRSFEPYPPGFNGQLKRHIRERDGDVCARCGKTKKQNGRKLPVHHIDYNKDNLNPRNLITLCTSCNGVVNKDRNEWTTFFRRKIRDIYKSHPIPATG